jgi:hypothetical protein
VKPSCPQRQPRPLSMEALFILFVADAIITVEKYAAA